MRHFKGRTALVANRILGRTGEFWQSEWFDHWTRDDTETARVTAYIRQNPVKAGLVRQWQDWPWRLPA
jgi:putative transposase